jgi:formamidopyrimidine-DNA glycosylase
MPELPDIVVYLEALEQRILHETLEHVTIASPFLLRTALPPITSVAGRQVVDLRRLGKRICIGLEGDLWLVLHLMIAGRLHWHARAPTASVKGRNQIRTGSGLVARRIASTRPPKNRLATFEFTAGTLSLTEAGSQRRASLHLIEGEAGLRRLDPGGLEIFEIDARTFAKVIQTENHTLKRTLTDPRLLSGIGNAYSDEILWEARLSPVALTQKLTSEEIERLFQSTSVTLTKWIELLRAEVKMSVSGIGSDRVPTKSKAQKSRSDVEMSPGKKGQLAPALSEAIGSFPEKVTAFRPEMAVHGKYQKPCPRCGHKVQRIRYASNETNYCPNCQTGGKLLADRALSRLLRSDWPRSADELEGLTSTSKADDNADDNKK